MGRCFNSAACDGARQLQINMRAGIFEGEGIVREYGGLSVQRFGRHSDLFAADELKLSTEWINIIVFLRVPFSFSRRWNAVAESWADEPTMTPADCEYD
jgi:hypothetical protein